MMDNSNDSGQGLNQLPTNILESLPVAVIAIDHSLRICLVNSVTENLLGMSDTFLLRQNLQEIVGADSVLVSLAVQVLKYGHSIAEFGITLDGPKLSKKKVDIRIAPTTDELDYFVIILQECSMARQMDLQLARGRAVRSVASLASVLAHEIKNPLSGIRGAAQLLEQSVPDPDRELTQLICNESDRIRDLVDRMDLFSDDRPLQREKVNIHDVLEHVRKVAKSGFGKNITFQENYDPSLPAVFGNRNQLIQLFLNLVKNASESIKSSNGTVLLETSYKHRVLISVAGSRDRLQLPIVVMIKDNGNGIPDDLKQSIFEPFVTTKSRGTGLGLALVAKIVEDHGGLIEVESHPGETSFKLFLPVHPDVRKFGPNLVEMVSTDGH